MIRGLTSHWKQVVAYYLTGNSINGFQLWDIIPKIIAQLGNCDINIRAIVFGYGKLQ